MSYYILWVKCIYSSLRVTRAHDANYPASVNKMNHSYSYSLNHYSQKSSGSKYSGQEIQHCNSFFFQHAVAKQMANTDPAPCVAQYWVRFFKNESTICSWPQNVGLKKSNIACPFIIQVRSSLFIWHKSQAELSEAKQERTISAHICCTQANVLGPHSRSVWFRARLILCLFDSQGHKMRIKGTKNLKYFYFLSSLIIYLKSGKERQLFVWAAHNLWPH